MFSLLVTSAIIANIVLAAGLRDSFYSSSFASYQKQFQKNYASVEEQTYRFQIFIENHKVIEAHNLLDSSYLMGVNQFTDLTVEEFSRYISPLPERQPSRKHIAADFTNMPTEAVVDWTEKGAVTPVKDQGACGSCWTFSVTGAVEGAYFVKNSKLLSLSEQQLVDCAGPYGTQGCNGGWMVDAFKYIVDHGICTEEDYPYKAMDSTCRDGKCTAAVKLSGYVDVPTNEVDLAKAVTLNPVSIAFDASGIMNYKSGIFDGKCASDVFNHAVLLTGYGEDNGKRYWKLKNSWGKNWGEQGYFKLKKDNGSKTGICGVAGVPSYPVVEV